MHVLPSDPLAASVFALGSSLDFVRREDVVRWADRQIQEMDQPPIWLIELSLSQNQHILDFITALKQIGADVEPETTCKAIYALLPDVSGFTFDQAEAMAKLVYRITRECLNGDWACPLLGETDEIADTFSHVRDGFTTLNEHDAIQQFKDFANRFRSEEVAKLLSPVEFFADYVAAFGAGPEAITHRHWESLLLTSQKFPQSPDFVPLVQEAMKTRQLRLLRPFIAKLWAYTNRHGLCFSRCTGYPFSGDCPYIVPLGSGRYEVILPSREIVGEGDAQEAVALAVQHLPPGCGPAVHGTASDLRNS